MGWDRSVFRAVSISLGLCICATPAFTQEANAGGASPDAADDLVALQFLVGDWTVHSFEKDDSGDFVQSPIISFFRARYLYDGLSILSEYYVEDRDGFYGVHVITFDSSRGLVHSYFNARIERRIEFEGSFRDGNYDLTRRGGYGGGDHLYRETDSEITDGSFVKRIYRSDDGGITWAEGDYCFRFERTR